MNKHSKEGMSMTQRRIALNMPASLDITLMTTQNPFLMGEDRTRFCNLKSFQLHTWVNHDMELLKDMRHP